MRWPPQRSFVGSELPISYLLGSKRLSSRPTYNDQSWSLPSSCPAWFRCCFNSLTLASASKCQQRRHAAPAVFDISDVALSKFIWLVLSLQHFQEPASLPYDCHSVSNSSGFKYELHSACLYYRGQPDPTLASGLSVVDGDSLARGDGARAHSHCALRAES